MSVLRRILTENDNTSFDPPQFDPPVPPKINSESDLIEQDASELEFFKSFNRLADTSGLQEKTKKLKKMESNVTISLKILDELKEYLDTFNANISNLSQQMSSLKNQSEELDMELVQSSRIERKIMPLVTDFTVAPEVIQSVLTAKVDKAWCGNLSYITLKLEIYDKYIKEESNYEGLSINGLLSKLKSLLDSLISKSCERIKDFFVAKIKYIRYSRNFALQSLQKKLLQMKEIYSFLQTHNSPLAQDLLRAYIYSVKWYFHKNFGKYLYSLEKLKIHSSDKNSALGAANKPAWLNASTSWLGSSKSSGSNSTNFGQVPETTTTGDVTEFFTLGDRLDTLYSPETGAIPAQMAETNPKIYHLETPFHYFNLALIDNGCVEYIFLTEFFQVKILEGVSSLFQEIFGPVFNLGVGFSKNYLAAANNYDMFSVLISIKLCESFLFKLQHRRVPVMENYLNLQIITLWPKYQLLVDYNCNNLKKALVKMNNLTESSVHPVTKQFSTLLLSLLKIASISASETPSEEQADPLTNSLVRFRNEYENLLNKLTGSFGDTAKREKFLFVNYSMIYSVISVVSVTGGAVGKEIEHFKLLKEVYSEK